MFFWKSKPSPLSGWPIIRTDPNGSTYGQAFPIFINNMQCHLTTFGVYADGLIDAWGMLDRDLFEQKIRSRWVVTKAKPDQSISVFNFGMTEWKDAKWLATEDDIRRASSQAIKDLNPSQKNLVDMRGEDTVAEGKIRRAKFSLPKKKPYRKNESTDILGDSVPVISKSAERFELTNLFVFADGMCRLGPSGKLVSLNEAHSWYDDGTLANFAPSGSRVIIAGLAEFTCANDFGRVDDRERQKEFRDMENMLRGGQGALKHCIEMFKNYRTGPSATILENLRSAYEAVPGHLRCYCGDMDSKDSEIKRVLGEKPAPDF